MVWSPPFYKGIESLPQITVFVKSTSLQPYDVNLWYFKLTLFDE